MLTVEAAKKIGIRACIDKLGREFVLAHRESATSAYRECDEGVFCFVGVDDGYIPQNTDRKLILTAIRNSPTGQAATSVWQMEHQHSLNSWFQNSDTNMIASAFQLVLLVITKRALPSQFLDRVTLFSLLFRQGKFLTMEDHFLILSGDPGKILQTLEFRVLPGVGGQGSQGQ